jgi:hypothetical protein
MSVALAAMQQHQQASLFSSGFTSSPAAVIASMAGSTRTVPTSAAPSLNPALAMGRNISPLPHQAFNQRPPSRQGRIVLLKLI